MDILIKKVCENKGLTIAELSKRTGIGRSTLYSFLNYESFPTLMQLEKIAISLNCRITDLFDSSYK